MDGLEPLSCQPWTSRLPKMAQPDLDFTGNILLNLILFSEKISVNSLIQMIVSMIA